MLSMSNTNEPNLDKMIHLMQTDKSFDAPQDAIRWSKNIFLSRAAAPQKSLVSRVLAVLRMDLSPNRAAFGERSASASQARQMLFQAGEVSVDLRIKKGENGLSVSGQILGANFANCAVTLSTTENSFEIKANELSEFAFTEIAEGIYNLSLKNGEQEIVLENLDLR